LPATSGSGYSLCRGCAKGVITLSRKYGANIKQQANIKSNSGASDAIALVAPRQEVTMPGSTGKNNYVRSASPVNIDELADIQDVVIDTSLPKKQRIESYLKQIKNPYCYRCDDMVIRVSFANTDATLEDRLKQYLLSGSRITAI
jgi:hypothetical protein